MKRPPELVICVLVLLAAMGLAFLATLAGCSGRKAPPIEAPPEIEIEPGRVVVDERPIAKRVDGARSETDRLRAELAAAESREQDAERRQRQREQDEQRRIAQAQAKYATWIAGIVFLGAIVYTVAAFAFGLPKRLGAVIGAGAVALLIGARAWSWLADKALIGALILVGIGACVGVWMLVRHWLAAGVIRQASEGMEMAETEADVLAVKAKAFAEAKRLRVLGLVARIRGKPVKTTLTPALEP